MKAKKFETSLKKSHIIPDSHWHHHEIDPNVCLMQIQSDISRKY